MSSISKDSTIREAQAYLQQNWVKGTTCPCCKRAVKLYHYKINSGQSYATILLYRITRELQPQDGWVHISNEFARLKINAHTLSYHRAAYWGLIEQEPTNDDPTKKTSGNWRITEKGRMFVENKITVAQDVYVYEGVVKAAGGKQVNIKEALDNKFDYEELMKG